MQTFATIALIFVPFTMYFRFTAITVRLILILTDLKMPGKTGADLIKIVEQKLGQNIKFIVMSGHTSTGVEGSDLAMRSYPFLRKPLDIENLIETVASVLETKE